MPKKKEKRFSMIHLLSFSIMNYLGKGNQRHVQHRFEMNLTAVSLVLLLNVLS